MDGRWIMEYGISGQAPYGLPASRIPSRDRLEKKKIWPETKPKEIQVQQETLSVIVVMFSFYALSALVYQAHPEEIDRTCMGRGVWQPLGLVSEMMSGSCMALHIPRVVGQIIRETSFGSHHSCMEAHADR
jgi:hypothetical protein